MNLPRRTVALLPTLATLLLACPRPHSGTICSAGDCPEGFHCDEKMSLCVPDASRDAGLAEGGAADRFATTDSAASDRTGHESGRPDGAVPPDAASTNDAGPSWRGVCELTYRIEITVDSNLSDAPLQNFPLLVRSGTNGSLANHARSDGSDLAFTDGDGVTRLAHEIERYDSSTGALLAWVRIPNYPGTAQHTFYLYFGGNAEVPSVATDEVWDAEFRGVWHFFSDPASTLAGPPFAHDSTQYQNPGDPMGGMSAASRQPGVIGTGWALDGVDDRIRVAASASLAIDDQLTVEAWYRADSVGNTSLVSTGAGEYQRGWDLSFDEGPSGTSSHDHMFRAALGSNGPITNASSWTLHPIDTWTHLVGVFDSSTCAGFFVNGLLDEEDCENMPAPLHVSGLDLVIGARADDLGPFHGTVDEVRVSATKRSAEWIKASHANQTDPSLVQLSGKQANPLNCE